MKIINKYLNLRKIFKSNHSFLNKCRLSGTYLLLEWKLLFGSIKKNKRHIIKLFNHEIVTFNYMMFYYVFIEIFINQDYEFDTNIKNPIIFDCGANMGLATIYFKWRYPQSNIVAFEPDKEVFKLLKENIESNKITGVTLVNAALSDKTGLVAFYSSVNENSWNFGIGSIYSERVKNMKKIETDCVCLSDYINGSVDFIKMDIEGSEDLVIEELMRSGKLNLIQEFKIEYHHKIGLEKSKLGNFLSFFEQNNYEYQIRGDYSKKQQFQDIILYAYKL